MRITTGTLGGLLLFLIFTASCSTQKSNEENPIYKNRNYSVEERVNDLLGRMTLEEKVAQMNMTTLRRLETDEQGNITKPSLDSLLGGPGIGFLESSFTDIADISKRSEVADRYLRENTRLGIPAIQIAECLHGFMAHGATIFPQAIGQGSTWNPELIQDMAKTIAREASLTGVDQALSPLFDLALDPRYGRVEECYGEDPFLVAEIGKAFVTGLQGDPKATVDSIPEGNLMAMAKHYLAYSAPIGGINLGPVSVGARDLRNLHLYPFKKAIQEANIYAVMPSYNELNGIPLHANESMLTDLLREEIGFGGYVFSDYQGIEMLGRFQKTASDAQDAGLRALKAGVEVEAPYPYGFAKLAEMVKSGKADETLIDNAVRHILTAKFKAGLFDKPYHVSEQEQKVIRSDEAKKLAYQVAVESVTLLKNENATLPLDMDKLKSVAVIGPNADRVQYGDYSYTKHKSSGITVLEGISETVGSKVEVRYAEGCGITDLDESGIKKAVETARESDAVVLVIGGTSAVLSGIGWGKEPSDYATCGEGYDRTELSPPGVQPKLIRAIQETGKPVVLVMVHGRPYSIAWENENLPAIVEAWYPGEQGGKAVADILFGNANPSGKLSVSVPKSVGHIPSYYHKKPSGKGYYRQRGTPEKPGRDFVFSSPDALYPFGHGLSYTTFEYSDLKIENKELASSDTLRLSLKVKNIGSVKGKEVVQVYLNDLVSSVTTPLKILKAFDKVEIAPQATATVRFEIPIKEMALWNAEMKQVVEPGGFQIMAGSSSEDIRLKDSFSVK
ncbi:glycosyl hydrolase family 3 [Fulvitalea axinellae]|uniref:Glycosyl hydrolase family 3 n=1 Tax=Fulvitalea axinellae TaxID=1182444 RepID=A0AAU9C7V6_9BACT|nr:glycosyl hydrolase family 3 [Fulvitalea axinellae]